MPQQSREVGLTFNIPEAKFVVQESDEPDAMAPQQEVSVCGPGDTRHTVGGQQIGCFGMLVMWFMFRSGRHVAMSCGHVMWFVSCGHFMWSYSTGSRRSQTVLSGLKNYFR